MGKSENHVYNIDLQINNLQSSKAAFKYMQDAFDASEQSIDALNKSYDELASKTEDATELQKQYNKIIEKSLKDKDSMIDKLNAEKIALLKNTDLTDEQRETQLKIINAKIKNIKLEKQMISAKTNEFKVEKKLSGLIKDDLKSLKNKVKEQFKFISALKTTEGRYNAMKRAAEAAANAGLKAAKFTAKTGTKVAGGALAFGGAMLGASASAADDVANKESALRSLKSGIDPSIVDQVYIKAPAGADWESIVAAVNNLSSVTKDNALLVQGAVLELKNPGVGKFLLSTTEQDPGNISKFANAIDQIKQQTGVQDQDISAALEAATKSKAVKDSGQLDYIQAYAALSRTGLEGDKIDSIITDLSKKGDNLIENLKKVDLTKYVQGQDKIRLKNTKLELNTLDLNKSRHTSAAQSTAEKLREFELKKNELLADLLPVVNEVLNIIKISLDSSTIKEIANGLVGLFKTAVPYIIKFLPKAMDALVTGIQNIEKVVVVAGKAFKSGGLLNFTDAYQFYSKRYDETESTRKKRDEVLTKLNDTLDKTEGKLNFKTKALKTMTDFAGGIKAQGGLVTAPAICGEAGPELVIPLDNSRAGRASQIINNFNTTQSFNMQSNQSTPLAFSQAIGQNRFIKRFAGA